MGMFDFLFAQEWRQKLSPASFRYVPFYALKCETSVGKRTNIKYGSAEVAAIQQKADANFKTLSIIKRGYSVGNTNPYVEELGVELEEYKIEGYVIANDKNGYDYFSQRDALASALRKSGPGSLTHPYLGEIYVYVKEKCTITESFEEGGICRFQMTFIQAGSPRFPSLLFYSLSYLDKSALDMMLQYLDDFASGIKSATTFFSRTLNAIKSTINKVKNAITKIANAITILANTVSSGITDLIATIDALANSPCDLAQALFDGYDLIKNTLGDLGQTQIGGVVGGCSGVRRGGKEKIDKDNIPESLGTSVVNSIVSSQDYEENDLGPGITGTAEQESNIRMVVDTSKAAALKTACEIGIRINFTSQEKAMALTSTVVSAFDKLLLRLGDPLPGVDNEGRYNATEKLRKTFIEMMIAKNSLLAKEIKFPITSGVSSSLTQAYDLYYDLDRANDIQYRNLGVVRHPGFLPSGNDIMVLNQ
jgi:prophage DNA circulation protein